MKLSIIIPAYNVEDNIQQCIEKILNNKSKEYEIIIINDGSNDKTHEICQEILKITNKIKYIYRKNEGCSRTRNQGIKLAKGEYIWFIDSDDFIENGAVDEIIKILKSNKKDLILFGYNKIYKNGIKEKRIPKEIVEKEDIYKQTLFFNSPWNKIYKKDIILKNKIYFIENCHMGEDLNFNFKFFHYICFDKIMICSKVYYNYKETDGATSNFIKRKEIFVSFDDIIQFYAKKNKNMKKVLKNYYKINCIEGLYNAIIKEKLNNKSFDWKTEIKLLFKMINKRKKNFDSNFFYLHLFFCLKLFLYPIYIKIKKEKTYEYDK